MISQLSSDTPIATIISDMRHVALLVYDYNYQFVVTVQLSIYW